MTKNIIENIINEKFASKAQQKFFYAQISNKKNSPKKRKEFEKMAKEFSKKTNFKKLPEKVSDLDEIVDENGNIPNSKKPTDLNTKGVTSNSTTDEFVKTGHGQIGNYYTKDGYYTRFYTESDLSKSLGFNDTIKKDLDFDDAENHFKEKLDLSDDDVKIKMKNLGYDENLPKDKINLIEELIDEIIVNRKILNKQINSIKENIKENNISLEYVIKKLKNE